MREDRFYNTTAISRLQAFLEGIGMGRNYETMRYIRRKKRDYHDEYKQAFEDIGMLDNSTINFEDVSRDYNKELEGIIGRGKTKQLRDKWSVIAGHRLEDKEMKVLTLLMLRPRSDISIRQDGTLFRRTHVMGEDTFTAPIDGSIK